MKKFFGFGKGKKKGLSPSPSDTSSVLSAGYQLQDKELDKLHRAAYSGDVSKIKQLLRKQDVNQQDNASRTPLHLACANGQTDVVSMLVENHAKVNLCDSENRSPLMKAIQCQQESCAAILLGHNADPNVVDVNGNAALHFAARIPSITIASQLLEHGADIDAPNKDGCTPLMLATIENNEEMVDFLIREGANINSKDVNERTSLMVAASNGHIGLVKMLLEHDAEISIQDEKGWSADDHAVMHGHHACSHLIIEHSARKKSSDPFHSAAKRRGTSGLSNPNKDVDGVFTLGSPATDKEELRVTPKQTSAARDAGKVTDDFSQAESESRASQKSAATDSWPSSDDDFDLSPQRAPKPNLKKLFHTKANDEGNRAPKKGTAKSQASLGKARQPACLSRRPSPKFEEVDAGRKNDGGQEMDQSKEGSVCEDVEGASESHEDGDSDDEDAASGEEEEADSGDEVEAASGEEEEADSGDDGEGGFGEELEAVSDEEDKALSGEEEEPDAEEGEVAESGDEKVADTAEDLEVTSQDGQAAAGENLEAAADEGIMEEVLDEENDVKCGDEPGDGEFDNEEECKYGQCVYDEEQSSEYEPVADQEASSNASSASESGKHGKDNDEAVRFTDDLPTDVSHGIKFSSLPHKDTQAMSEGSDVPVSLIIGFYEVPGENTASDLGSDVTCQDQIKNNMTAHSNLCAATSEVVEHDSKSEDEEVSPTQSVHKLQNVSGFVERHQNDPSDDEADGKEGSDFEDHPEETAIKAAIPRTHVEEKLPGPAEAVGRKETLMSELGLDEDDVESPWDSEASVASPRKQSSMKLTQSSNEELFQKKSSVEKDEPRAVGSLLPMKEASPTSPSVHSSTNVKSDVSELESTSFSLKVPANAPSIGKFTEEPLGAKARTKAPGPLTDANKASSLPPTSKRSDHNDDSEEEDHRHPALKENLLTPSKKDLQRTESSDEFSEESSAVAVEETKTTGSLSPTKEVFSSVSSARTSEGYTKSDSVKKGVLTQANPKSLDDQKGKEERKRLPLKSDSDDSHSDGKAVQRKPTLSDLQNKPKQMARDRHSKGKDGNSSEGSKNTRLIKKSGLRKPHIQQRATTNGNPMDAFDDSSLSETSQEDAGRNGNQYLSGNKIDADEFSQSSDTASDAFDSPTFRNAMLIMEELTVVCPGSLNLIKIEDLIRKYERSLQKETGKYALLTEKVKSMETDHKDLQQLAERNRELTSRLEHQKVEWESDLNHLRFMLKQEEEKRKSSEMLYDKGRDQLRKKEDQCCKEMEEKQQLEMALRNMEREVRSLSNNVKKAEEERNEAQRLLSQERNARALQEDFLNNLRRKNEEEEARIIMTKTAEVHSQFAESSEREKDLLQRYRTLQDEITLLRQELEKVQRLNEEEKHQYAEDNEMLKEKVDDLKRDLKVNEESLTQNLIQYNGQLNALRTEATIFCTKLEHEKQAKERLETELESFRSRLTSALQELEKSQTSKTDVERSLQRERDEWMRSKDKLSYDLANSQENNKNLSQQLGKAEAKCNDLECELHRKGLSLQERVVLLESTQRELTQAQCRIKELESTLLLEKDQFNKSTIRQESTQERLVQVQNENLQLRQQLDDLQSKGVIKDKAVTDVQDRFTDIFGKLRADTERQVSLVEERNKDLINKSNELREQIYRLETEKVEGESSRRQLQQELADAFKKLSMSEASLEVITRYRNDLEEEKQNLHKELEKCKNKLQDLEEQYIQSERLNHQLKNVLDDKEREIVAAIQKVQELSTATAAAEKSAKQLEEHVQKLEIENAKIEATAKHQTNQIEILQRELQESIANRNRMEDLVTSLQSSKMGLEDKLNKQVYKQTAVSLTAQESHNMWEEELKSRSRLGIRLAELDREKAELAEQVDRERKKVKKLAEMKRSMDSRFDEEVKRSGDLQRELSGMKRLLKMAKKKLKEYESSGNQQSKTDRTTAHKNLDDDPEFCRLKDKMEQLSVTLESESMKHKQLESRNRELQDELYSMTLSHKKQERHEKGRRHLEDEVADLKRHLESSKMDQSTVDSFKREIEEKGRQEVRQKLEEVNLFLQTQAAAQDSLEQIRAATDASLRSQLESRIQDLENELHKIKSAQKESECQKESSQTELDRFKEFYSDEMKMRKSLAGKLERTYERLEEANTKLLNERQRSKSLIASSIVSGNLGPSPVLDVSPLGLHSRSLTMSGGFGPGGSFLSSTGNGLTANRMDSYLAQVQLDLEKSIARELQQANTGPETGYTRVPPVGSTAGTVRNLDAELDPLSRTAQQYLEVLKKNNML